MVEPKSEVVTLRLTLTQATNLRACAAQEGKRFSEWLRDSAILRARRRRTVGRSAAPPTSKE